MHSQRPRSLWLFKSRIVAVPPLSKGLSGKGYPLYFVEIDGFTFRFSSLAELRVCIAMLEQKHLPTTIRLSDLHGGAGPNSHWLSRLPKETKSWRYREKAISYLSKALFEFEQVSADRA